jgi:prenylcysteine alpha-carboxyl methylesterase
MPSQTLPITNLQLPNLLSSSSTTTMLLKDSNNVDDDDDNDPSKTLLISSSFNNNKIMSIKPLLSRSSSFNSIGVGVNSFYQKRRRRVASEDSLSFVSNGTSSSNRSSSSFGRDVRHVASETYLITRLGLKMLSYLGYENIYFHSFHLYKLLIYYIRINAANLFWMAKKPTSIDLGDTILLCIPFVYQYVI